jgi:hypothetical protein
MNNKGCELCLPMRAGWLRTIDTKRIVHQWIRCGCNPEPEGYVQPLCLCSLCLKRNDADHDK